MKVTNNTNLRCLHCGTGPYGYHSTDCRMAKDHTAAELRKQIDQTVATEREQMAQQVAAEQTAAAMEYEKYLSTLEPQKQQAAKQLEVQNRKTFADAAKTLRSFAENEANFRVLCDQLGELTVFGISQAVQSGTKLVPPTEDQLADYKQQDIAAKNAWLDDWAPA